MAMEDTTSQTVATGADGQADQPISVKQSGSDSTPKSYTQSEWDTREMALAAKDRENGNLRNYLAQQALAAQASEALRMERAAASEDSESVDAGDLTKEQASHRADQRQRLHIQEAESRQRIQQNQRVYQQMMGDMNQRGRLAAAEDFAKEYGLGDPRVLLYDASLTTPDAMRAKAAHLAWEREKGKQNEQHFDGGQIGSKGVNIDSLSPMEKIRRGVASMK